MRRLPARRPALISSKKKSGEWKRSLKNSRNLISPRKKSTSPTFSNGKDLAVRWTGVSPRIASLLTASLLISSAMICGKTGTRRPLYELGGKRRSVPKRSNSQIPNRNRNRARLQLIRARRSNTPKWSKCDLKRPSR